MVLAVESVDTSNTPALAQTLRCIDTDVHNDLPSLEELRPFLPKKWHIWLDSGGPGAAARYYANMGSGRMDDAVREEDGLCAGDPDWVAQQLMAKYRIDLGILTGVLFDLSIQHDHRFYVALASAYNEWTLEKWVRPYDCFKGSIACPAQDVEAAAAEVRRLGRNPGMVQVLLAAGARLPYGNAHYWPIYRAAAEHDLPIAIHIGGEGTGIANAPTGVGVPSTYLEFHTGHSKTMMAHCVSLIAEGVFEEFPALKFAFRRRKEDCSPDRPAGPHCRPCRPSAGGAAAARHRHRRNPARRAPHPSRP